MEEPVRDRRHRHRRAETGLRSPTASTRRSQIAARVSVAF